MTPDQLVTKYSALTTENQKLVDDLLDGLKCKDLDVLNEQTGTKIDFENEPFFGMWADREDMADSTQRVRELRQKQWSRRINASAPR